MLQSMLYSPMNVERLKRNATDDGGSANTVFAFRIEPLPNHQCRELRLGSNDVRAPIRQLCTRNVRRIFGSHVSHAISVYRRAGVITPSRHSAAAELRIASKAIFRFVPGARDTYRADSCVVDRGKCGAGIVIRSDEREDDSPLLVCVNSNGWVE